MEARRLHIIFNKAGSGSMTTRLTIPKKWMNEMKISPADRDILAIYDGNNITITKESDIMMELKERLLGKTMDFIELDNFMMENGFYTVFDSGIDFDEIAEDECIVYQAIGNEDEYTHIEFKLAGDSNGCNTEIEIVEIWVE